MLILGFGLLGALVVGVFGGLKELGFLVVAAMIRPLLGRRFTCIAFWMSSFI